MKTCKICKVDKELEQFSKKTASSDGLFHQCKSCIKFYRKNYDQKNKDKKQKHSKTYYEKNKKNIINKSTEYRNNNKDLVQKTVREYEKNRRKNDILFKLTGNLRHRTNMIFKNNNFFKNQKFKDYLGCTVEYLTDYLQKKFKNGMNWNNHGDWHIDHIIPLSSAKTEEEVYKLCHYTNLQPLWAKENMSKGNKING